jgi:predicted ribosomally synthesized peptide with nif11-like leader
MKTLEDFIQRLQVDTAFEKQAQAFDNADDLMAFVKSQGYDFTLEQLMREFKQGAKLPAEAAGLAPAPMDVRASTPPKPDGGTFLRKPEAFPNGGKSPAPPKSGSPDFTREQPGPGLQKPKRETPLPGPAEESPGGFLRVGGGRHRGFSPQRLKSLSAEDP